MRKVMIIILLGAYAKEDNKCYYSSAINGLSTRRVVSFGRDRHSVVSKKEKN
jgi:hypothetical protein